METPEQFLRRAMEAHGPAVYRLALCRTQSVPDAEDVYQDVFLRLLNQRDGPAWEPEHLKAWLLRTALNRCADLHRLRLRRPVVPKTRYSRCPTHTVSGASGRLSDTQRMSKLGISSSIFTS